MGNCLEGTKGADPKTMTPNPPDSTKSSNGVISTQGPKKTIQKNLLESHTVDVYEKYEECEVLGRGSMGHVARVVLRDEVILSRRSVGDRIDANKPSVLQNADLIQKPEKNKRPSFALKSIQLDRISQSFITELKNEIDILNAMDHPNIVRLHEIISHRKQIFMILELCDGGDLYTRLPYTEKDSAYITGKLLSAIKYMHDHAIVHRDRE